MSFSADFLKESIEVINHLDCEEIEKLVKSLNILKFIGGRLFILGNGGSAGTASHAVNDFRKICNIETYTPTDNVSELTARINDDGFDTSYVSWLKGSKLNEKDSVLILSVGGGNKEKNVSMNLVHAMDYAWSVKSTILGIVGKDGGYTNSNSFACVVVPPLFSNHITPHTESICSIILHLIVSHPDLKSEQTKWESIK